MKKNPKPNLQFVLVIEEKRVDCYWCGRLLRKCGTCGGTGLHKEHTCYPCKGSGQICPTHIGDWE